MNERYSKARHKAEIDGTWGGEKDNINQPEHYTLGKIEVYDFITAWELSFTEGNIIKYVVRSPYKGKRLDDLKKAQWYLNKLIVEAKKELPDG